MTQNHYVGVNTIGRAEYPWGTMYRAPTTVGSPKIIMWGLIQSDVPNILGARCIVPLQPWDDPKSLCGG